MALSSTPFRASGQTPSIASPDPGEASLDRRAGRQTSATEFTYLNDNPKDTMTRKISMITAAVLALVHGVSLANEPAEPQAGSAGAAATSSAPMSNNDKVLYSLGYELGKDLKRQELDLSPEPLLQGVEDALSNARPVVKASERNAALKDIKRQREEANLEASLAFLTANAEKDGVKTLPSGLQYRELKPGEGKTPTTTSQVTVNYRGSLIDGSEFASSYEQGRPSTFLVRKVIKGWREALQLMNEGAKWELYIPPDLAYGKQSPRNRIPPNSALIYEVELLKTEEAPAPKPRPTAPVLPPASGAGAGDGT
jgi:FKBP-type peptidyl-prolyl cis-trans isomerase FklB